MPTIFHLQNVLIIPAGGNDLGIVKNLELMSEMKWVIVLIKCANPGITLFFLKLSPGWYGALLVAYIFEKNLEAN